MSGTSPAPTLRDQLVADARSVPDLIAKAKDLDPTLAEQLTGKALVASKTPWGVLVAGIVGWGVAHWGLGWSSDTTDLVAGAAVVVGAYAMRWITRAPITGIVKGSTP